MITIKLTLAELSVVQDALQKADAMELAGGEPTFIVQGNEAWTGYGFVADVIESLHKDEYPLSYEDAVDEMNLNKDRRLYW